MVTVQSDEWSRLSEGAQQVAFLERLLGTAAKPVMDTMQSLLAQFSGTGYLSLFSRVPDRVVRDLTYQIHNVVKFGG